MHSGRPLFLGGAPSGVPSSWASSAWPCRYVYSARARLGRLAAAACSTQHEYNSREGCEQALVMTSTLDCMAQACFPQAVLVRALRYVTSYVTTTHTRCVPLVLHTASGTPE